jgi:molecular chaperone DnaJ
LKDPYEILGVGRNVSQDEILKAYRSMAVKYHPDKNPENPSEASEKFKEVSWAFEVIGDEQKRRNFDSFGPASFSFRSRNSVDDVFENMFSQFFGEQNSQGSRLRIKIGLEEAYSGCSKKVPVEKRGRCEPCRGTGSTEWEPCKRCEGKGFIFTNNGPMRMQVSCSGCAGRGSTSVHKCKDCVGKGYVVESTREVELRIPPGIDDGMQIRLAGEAGDGSDLFVVVNVEKHPSIARQDRFLVGGLEVPYHDLVLGGQAEFDLFGSKISVKIPPRTNAGSRVKIKGCGMPHINNPAIKGDLFLDIKLGMPSSLTEEHESLIRQLSKLGKQD